MAKASDNDFPSVLFVEGSAPASPASGDQRIYIDVADHKLKRKNSSGTVTTIEGGGGSTTLAADTDVSISSPAAGQPLTYDGAHWINGALADVPGIELGYVDSATPFTTSSGSLVDVTSMSLTVTVGARPILCEFWCGAASHSVAGDRLIVALIDVTGSTTPQDVLFTGPPSANPTPLYLRARLNPAAGSRTYKIQARAVDAGTVSLSLDTGKALTFQIRNV